METYLKLCCSSIFGKKDDGYVKRIDDFDEVPDGDSMKTGEISTHKRIATDGLTEVRFRCYEIPEMPVISPPSEQYYAGFIYLISFEGYVLKAQSPHPRCLQIQTLTVKC